MSVDASRWVVYADENLAIAQMALDGGYYNACLQNAQQAVEKYLKAMLLMRKHSFQKTHSIGTLNNQLVELGIPLMLTEEDCILLDSIYMPSKYPFGSALPDFNPDSDICMQCLSMVNAVRKGVFSEGLL